MSCPAALSAHPVFSSSSIVNAASFQPPELPGGAVARGSIFSIFGRAIGPLTAVQATEFPLSASMGGVTITVSKPGFPTATVLPLFVSESQVNAILPSDAPLGEATLRVRYDDQDGNPSSIPVDVTITESNVGLFTVNASGRGPVIANNFESQTDQPLNSTRRSARPGQVVTLWATGLGGIPGGDRQRPADVGGVVDLQVAAGLEVYFGGVRAANVLYAGRSPEFAGLDQLVVQVPEGTPLGCYVPLWLRVHGGLVSNVAAISISAAGGSCDDPLNPHLGEDAGRRIGDILLSRVAFEAGSATDVQDTGAGAFEQLFDNGWHFNPAFSLPPLGTCAVYSERDAAGGVRNQAPAAPLEAGQLIVEGPLGSRFLTTSAGSGLYETLFSTTDGDYLEPGAYTLRGAGRGSVGTFSATVTMPPATAWTLTGSGGSVDRSAGLTVEWTPGDATQTYTRILLISSDGPSVANNVTSTVFCTAPADAGTFTVQPDFLANTPVSVGSGVSSSAALFVGLAAQPEAGRFAADGLDAGFFTAFTLLGRPITVR